MVPTKVLYGATPDTRNNEGMLLATYPPSGAWNTNSLRNNPIGLIITPGDNFTLQIMDNVVPAEGENDRLSF